MKKSTVTDSLCFKLYLSSKLMTSMHQKFLHEIGLTFPQFLVMGLLWEQDAKTVKEMGELLYLDSGTLTPIVKRLEKKKLLVRVRSKDDERSNIINLTPEGSSYKDQAIELVEKFHDELGMGEKETESMSGALDVWIDKSMRLI